MKRNTRVTAKKQANGKGPTVNNILERLHKAAVRKCRGMKDIEVKEIEPGEDFFHYEKSGAYVEAFVWVSNKDLENTP